MSFKKSSVAEPLCDDVPSEPEPAESARLLARPEGSALVELSDAASALIRVARAGLKPSLGDRRRVSVALGRALESASSSPRPRAGQRKRQR